MKKTLFVILTLLLCFTSCSNDNDELRSDNKLSLFIEKSNVLDSESRAIIESTSFASGDKIGVWLKSNDGSNYNPEANNVLFTAGTGNKWTAERNVYLTGAKGKIIGFYPYSSNITSHNSISISSASQTDYMYSGAVPEISSSQSTASLTMKHAMACVRFQLKKNTYKGSGVLSKIEISGANVGISGILNAESGAVSSVTKGKVSATPAFTLTSSFQNVDILVVPTGETGELSCDITIDGKVYNFKKSGVALTKGTLSVFQLSVNHNPVIRTETTYELSASPTSYTFSASGGSYTFTITCTKVVTTYTDDVPGTPVRTSYTPSYSLSGTGFSRSGNTISASANTSTSARPGSLVLTAGDKSVTISLMQKGRQGSVTVGG